MTAWDAVTAWRQKLAFMRAEEAKVSDAEQKFSIAQRIAEAKAKLAEAEAEADLERVNGGLQPAAFHPDVSRIDRYAPAELLGRGNELALLTDAWESAQRGETPRPRVLTFVALGGEGKTSLVANWLAELAGKDWLGCEAAFAWSFYSQGTREQMAGSSDLFLKEALIFFGDPELAGSARSAYDKGRRLAELVGGQRSLLVLDGVEPLQHPPGSPLAGELKDPGVSALLKALAAQSRGVCVVTTRYSIADLRGYRRTTAPEVELARLPREAGLKLLRSLGVHGATADFEALVEEVKGHALTLTLLGRYLARACGGDIRRRDLVRFEAADDKVQGGHAFRTIAAYETWLASAGAEGRRELAVLSLMGLFDRPADAGCLRALRTGPAIAGLTESIADLADDDWELTLTGLAQAKLLTVNRDSARALSSLDAHPLLREYFAGRLRARHPGAWRAAHRRLYEHLCANTNEGPEPKLEDLQPLYQAVAHGCQAGLHEETRAKLYRDRISRGTEAYSANKLGAFGADLGAVACFFEQPWSRVSRALTEDNQAWLLNQAGFRLRALGRLSEAVEPMRAALEIAVKLEKWKNAAVAASNLGQLELTLGEVTVALRDAEASIDHADRSGDLAQRIGARTTLASAQHQAGHHAKAQECFREAEALLAEQQLNLTLLNSVTGFWYCELLLASAERAAWKQRSVGSLIGEHAPRDLAPGDNRILAIRDCDAVAARAARTLEQAEESNVRHLDIALDHLTLGRSALYAAILGSPRSHLPTAALHVTAAVDGLRRAGRQDQLPRALLTRALLCSLTGARTSASSPAADLDEAWEIAERGPMPLLLADIHLHRSRLFSAVKPYPWVTGADGGTRGPCEDLAEARALIERYGYWRRREELEDAEKQAQEW
jgi:tetratricopeptide (TPR) repeat protein